MALYQVGQGATRKLLSSRRKKTFQHHPVLMLKQQRKQTPEVTPHGASKRLSGRLKRSSLVPVLLHMS